MIVNFLVVLIVLFLKHLLYKSQKNEADLHVYAYCFRFISYPRTETNMFPKSLDLRPLIQNQTVDANWGGKFKIV